MKKLGAAIIGCGNIYKNHANVLSDSENSRLVCVVDIDEKRAKEAAKIYKCKYYTDYKEMLKNPEVEVVHICTPHYLHSSMAIEAINAGKHVLTEKPMDINVENSKKMIEQARKARKYLGVCFQNRYNSTSVKAKAILEEGSLGKLKGMKAFVTWNRGKDYYLSGEWRGKFETEGGGLLINQAIHTLDLMQWFGGKIQSVKANVDTRLLDDVIEVEDTADATFLFKNGAVGLFYGTNCYTTDSPVVIELHCEKGILKIDGSELYMVANGEKTLIEEDRELNSSAKAYWGTGHKKLINHFYECILNGDESFVSGEDGIKSMEIINAIYRSSSFKRMVNL